ncbi:hypothetical protein B5X24_HaOG213902 [Helicoverpa armigera]|nr:hypothetical protein B5X24_HaOG213902 [Helicoverpa armigera]
METYIEKNKNKDDEREWDEDSDSESASSDGAAGDLRVPQSKKDHRVDAFLKRKKDDLGSSSCGRGAPAKKADRRPEKGRVAEAPKDKGGAAQQSSSEEDSAAVGSDQERRANFAKTVAAAGTPAQKGTAEQATCGGAERAAQEGGCTAKAQGRNNGPGAEDPGANTSTGSVVGTSGETPSEAESICGPYLPCHSVRVAGGGGKQKETEGCQSGQIEGPKTAAQTASRRGAAPRPQDRGCSSHTTAGRGQKGRVVP